MIEEAARRLMPRPLRQAITRASGYAFIDGVRIPIDPAVVSDRMLKSIANGTYERAESHLLRRIVRKGDRILELGAGIGFISALAGRLSVGGAVSVVEANPSLIPLIEATHRANGIEANIINAVIVDEPESTLSGRTMPFHLREDFWASSLDATRPGIKSSVDVPLKSLASLLAEAKPDVLVFDIEGGEDPLFASADLPGVRAVCGEFHPDIVGLAATTRIIQNFLRQGLHLVASEARPNNLLFARDETRDETAAP